MYDIRLRRRMILMHPQLMTMYADAQAQAVRDAAATRRRGRILRDRAGWSFSLHLPRRKSTRLAH
jgi:hypothetical protein